MTARLKLAFLVVVTGWVLCAPLASPARAAQGTCQTESDWRFVFNAEFQWQAFHIDVETCLAIADFWIANSLDTFAYQITGGVSSGQLCRSYSTAVTCVEAVGPVGIHMRVDSQPYADVRVPWWQNIGCITNPENECEVYRHDPTIRLFGPGLPLQTVYLYKGGIYFFFTKHPLFNFRLWTDGIGIASDF